MGVFKRTIKGKKSSKWYGKLRVGKHEWRNIVLYTDKTASERELMNRQAEMDQRMAGVITPQMEHAPKPLAEHVKDYIEDLRRQNCDSEHVYICELYMDKIIDRTKWHRLAEITAESFQRVLGEIQKEKSLKGATMNRYIARMKAFTRWLFDGKRILVDPLAGIKPGREISQGRRALTDAEVVALLKAPIARQRAYRVFLLTGLRRAELEDLRWGDLHLDSEPAFLQLRAEQTKNGKAEQLPLNPELVTMFKSMTRGMATDRVFAALPTKSEMLDDIKAAGIDPATQGIGLCDLHSLRHTFDHIVIKSGATVKEAQTLMRHSDPRLTMNVYAKAGLSSVAGVMNRITLGGASLDQNAPQMHQQDGVLGHCTVSLGTTDSGDPPPEKLTKYREKSTKNEVNRELEPTGIEPATPSLQS
jgi:integrase